MADEEPTNEERREAVDAYTRDMHAYTFRLWTEVRRQAEQRTGITEEARRQENAQAGGGNAGGSSAGGGTSGK